MRKVCFDVLKQGLLIRIKPGDVSPGFGAPDSQPPVLTAIGRVAGRLRSFHSGQNLF